MEQAIFDRVANLTPEIRTLASIPSARPSVKKGAGRLCSFAMSTTFRLLKSCSTASTVSRSRTGTRLSTGADHTTLHVDRVPFSSSVGVRHFTYTHSFLFCWCDGVCPTGVAAQKSCKRRVHVAASTVSSTTTTQLPGTGATFSSSTGGPSDPTKLRSLYAHTSRRTRSTSTLSASIPNSKTSSQGSQLETSPAFTSGTSEELATHLNKTFGGLVFPPELATRLLTHASHPASRVVGHNGRFAFTGECSRPFRSPLTPPFCAFGFEEKINGSNPMIPVLI